MKKINLKSLLVLSLLLGSSFAFSQTKNPVSQQRRVELLPGQKLPEYRASFNPTMKTIANPALIPTITDGVDVRIFPSSSIQAEVTIAINRSNPLNLLASANTYVSTYNQGYYSSSDGGATWSGSDVLSGISLSQVYGDPTVCFANDGAAYMTSINALGGYWFQKSTNGGTAWSAASRPDKGTGYDKGMSTSDDVATSPYVNSFYHAWSDFNSGNGAVVLNRSADGGATFLPRVTLRSGAVGFGQGTCVQTGLNGEVYVCYADHTSVISPYPATGMGFVKSLDGGATFTPATVIFPYSGNRVDYTSSVYNFSRVNDFPSMAVDKSSRKPGRIYTAYSEKNSIDGHSEIKVRFSDNQGSTWSSAVTVNIPIATQSFFPWITVDATTGLVFVAYYAFDQPTGYSTNTYVAISLNGVKWKNQKVSDVPHITAAINNTLFATGYAGDYIGIAAQGGKAYPTWMDNRNGTWQVYCSPLTISRAFADAQDIAAKPVETNKLIVSPNPFKGNINVTLSLKNIRSVELYHQNGSLTKRWDNVSSGTTLNVGTVPRGTYVIKVTDKDNVVHSQTIIKE